MVFVTYSSVFVCLQLFKNLKTNLSSEGCINTGFWRDLAHGLQFPNPCYVKQLKCGNGSYKIGEKTHLNTSHSHLKRKGADYFKQLL